MVSYTHDLLITHMSDIWTHQYTHTGIILKKYALCYDFGLHSLFIYIFYEQYYNFVLEIISHYTSITTINFNERYTLSKYYKYNILLQYITKT